MAYAGALSLPRLRGLWGAFLCTEVAVATKSSRPARVEARPASSGQVRPAIIVELGEEPGRALVRATNDRGAAAKVPALARIAQVAGYRPSEGDRVLVAGDGEDLYVIAVLHAAKAPGIELPDGAVAEVRDGALELRDDAGRLLVRYAAGQAEIASPAGDLTLSAPAGRVVLRSGLDVAIDAARDVIHHAGRRVDIAAGEVGADPQVRVEPGRAEVKADQLSLQSKTARFVVGQASVFARVIATTAERVATSADRYELTATRLVEKTRDTFRDVADLAQSRIGRARTIVSDVYSLSSGRSVMVSKEETRIDGSKVLLG